MKLESGVKYKLQSPYETVEAEFHHTVYHENCVWHAFLVNSTMEYYILINDYLCHPKGNYVILGRIE